LTGFMTVLRKYRDLLRSRASKRKSGLVTLVFCKVWHKLLLLVIAAQHVQYREKRRRLKRWWQPEKVLVAAVKEEERGGEI
jgi:hypothetical protein